MRQGSLRPRLAVALAVAVAIGLVAASAGQWLIADLPPERTLQPPRLNAVVALGLLGFPVMGALIASRRPRDPIGWLLIAEGGGYMFTTLPQAYAAYGLFVAPGTLPAVDIVAWLAGFVWAPIWPILLHVLIVFPDGRPLSRRWASWIPITWIAVGLVAIGYAASTPIDLRTDRPPLGTAHPTGAMEVVTYSGLYLLVVCLIAGAASVVVRFRRSRGVERAQLKWLAYAGSLAAAGAVIAGTTTALFGKEAGESTLATVPLIVGPTLVPFAVGIAVLRYRLYEIDVLINRTLVYGATVAVIGAGFVGATLLLQALLRPFTAGSDLAIAGSTLATVAAFQPIRRRIQAAVDRRFYRSRYDASRTLDSFASRMRDQVDIDAVRIAMLDVVASTLRPAHASVWLREAR